MAIEEKIIGRLLFKAKDIQTLDIEAKWFKEKSKRDIVETLIRLDGEDLPMIELAEEIKNDYPHTPHDVDTLTNLHDQGLINNLEELTHRLHDRYLTDLVAVSSAEYGRTPDNKNYQRMKDAIQMKDEADIPDEDGSLDSSIEELFYELDNEVDDGIKTYPQVDNTLGGGMQGGMLITIGARTGVGKTAYGINLACQALAKQKDIRMDFFTLEMSQKQMLKRFVSRMTEINSYKLRNPHKSLSGEQKAMVIGKSHELLTTHLRIHDSKFTLKDIEIEIRRNHHEAGDKPYIAFIDYLQLIDMGSSQAQRYVQVGEITRLLKQLTNELDIPIIIFAQLSRGIENRDNKTPVLSDLRESGSIEQDSNVVMFLYADEETDETIVRVAKNREGFTGDIRYRFLKTKMYFMELAEHGF